jgi:hypothetical protein
MEMPEDQFALYAEFSITAEKAQVLENEAGNVVIYYRALFVNTDEITPVEEVNRKPLGVLLKKYGHELVKIWARAHFDATIIDVADEGLKSRNYLTHHFSEHIILHCSAKMAES